VGGDLGPQVSSLLRDGASDTGTLHLALGVDDDARIVLEVDDSAILAAPGLALTDDDGAEDLLAELRLALLHGAHDDVTETRGGQAVQAAVVALDGDHVQVLRASVVSAVHDGADGQSHGHTEAAALNVDLILTHVECRTLKMLL
jgi:hypothetical protein